jgi:hypothetical protein
MMEQRDVTVIFIEGERERHVDMKIDWPPKLHLEHLVNEQIDPVLPLLEVTLQYKFRSRGEGSLEGGRDQVTYVLMDEHLNGGYSDGD